MISYKDPDVGTYSYSIGSSPFNSDHTFVSGAFSFVNRSIDCKTSRDRISFTSGLLGPFSTSQKLNLVYYWPDQRNTIAQYEDLTLNLGAISIAYGNSNTV